MRVMGLHEATLGMRDRAHPAGSIELVDQVVMRRDIGAAFLARLMWRVRDVLIEGAVENAHRCLINQMPASTTTATIRM
jgi:hypothetical protein